MPEVAVGYLAVTVGPPQRLADALTALNVPHDLKVYLDAGHSFVSTKSTALAAGAAGPA